MVDDATLRLLVVAIDAASDSALLDPLPIMFGEAGIAVAGAAVENNQAERGAPGPRVISYYEMTVPQYSEIGFKEHFRMLRPTFEVKYSINILMLSHYCRCAS